MNITIKVALTTDDLRRLADKIDQKVTKRTATRKEVNEIVRRDLAGHCFEQEARESGTTSTNHYEKWSTPEPEDEALLRGKSRGYIYGWNKAKHHNWTTQR